MKAYPFDRFKQIVESTPHVLGDGKAWKPAVSIDEARGVRERETARGGAAVDVPVRVTMAFPVLFGDGPGDSAERNAGHVANFFVECAEAMRANGAEGHAPPIFVSDREAEFASDAAYVFVMAGTAIDAGALDGVRPMPRSDSPASKEAVAWLKNSLAAGRCLDASPELEARFPDPSPATRSARQAIFLSVARAAVLMRRLIWGVDERGFSKV